MRPTWKKLGTRTINENPYGGYYVHDFEISDGTKGEYFFHKNRDAVSGFVMQEDGSFVMLREYRFLFDRLSLSQVQGGIEEGESPEQTFAREVVEEVGFAAKNITKVGAFATAPAFSMEYVHVYLAQDLEPRERMMEAREYIEPVVMSADEIDAAIRSGEIWDGQVITAWQFVKLHLEKNQDNT